jgi:hypothetical protein
MRSTNFQFVMTALEAVIQSWLSAKIVWMAGSSPAMTFWKLGKMRVELS